MSQRAGRPEGKPGVDPGRTAAVLAWELVEQADPEDVAVIAEGVLAHGRAQALDGNARAVVCLVRDEGRVVAGGAGRTEYDRLFVGHLWVDAPWRGQGIGTRILAAMEAEAARRGCRDSIIETLDDAVAALYARRGYSTVARIEGYVGPFTRHVLVKASLALAFAPR